MNQPIVTIPVYKERLSEYEKVSFFQCCKILKKHKFSLICPEGLNLGMYKEVFNGYGIDYQVKRFSKEYFTGIEKYNELLLSMDFYECFTGHDYMLVYQLDAYVFSDKLNYWCKQGYDYIGAPWFESFDSGGDDAKIVGAGNGGFSLRKIDSFIKVLRDKGRVDKFIKEQVKNNINEDIFFSTYAKEIEKEFKVAPPEVAMYFSFECKPEKLYEITKNELPFGCHAWDRFGLDFWAKFIDLSEVDFKREDKINKEEISKLKSKLTYFFVLQNELKEKQKQLGDICKKLADKREQVVMLQKEFAKKSKQLTVNKTRFIEEQKKLDNAKKELEKIYSSFEWRIVLVLKKFLRVLIPSEKLYRKIRKMLKSKK